MDFLPRPYPNDAVPTQPRFALQYVQRDSQQPLSELLPRNFAILIPHQ
jgi:hypothetical protein